MGFDEKKIKNFIKPHILRGRKGDWNHAKRVIKWVNKLGKDRVDLPLLIVAGYIHDIGWRDVLPPQKLSFEMLLQYEGKANVNSEPHIREVTEKLGFSEEDIATILRFVKVADRHKSQAEDEAIIVDADNLSKLDIDHLKEKFKEEEWGKMYNLWKEELPTRIKTPQGKKLYPALLEKLLEDINKSQI